MVKRFLLFVDEANLEQETENEYRVTRLHFYVFKKKKPTALISAIVPNALGAH